MDFPPATLPLNGDDQIGPLYQGNVPTYPKLSQLSGFGSLPFQPFGGFFDNFNRANSLLNGSVSTSGHVYTVVGVGTATAQVLNNNMRAGADTGTTPTWVNTLYAFVNFGGNCPSAGGAFKYIPIPNSANNPNVNITTFIMGNGTAIANWLHLEISPTHFAFGIFDGSGTYSGDLVNLPLAFANIGGGPYKVGMTPTFSGGFVTSVLLDIPGYSPSDPRMTVALPSQYLGTINASWLGYEIRPDNTANPSNTGDGGAAGEWNVVWGGTEFGSKIRGAIGAPSTNDLALVAGAPNTSQRLSVTPFPLVLNQGPGWYTIAYGGVSFIDYSLAVSEFKMSIEGVDGDSAQYWNFNAQCDSLQGLQSYSQTLGMLSPVGIQAIVPNARMSWDGTGDLLNGAVQFDIFLAATEIMTGSVAGSVMTITGVTQGALTVGEVVTAAGIPAGTYIESFGSGAGGEGTYNLSASATVAGGTTIQGAVPTNVNISARGSVTLASVPVPNATVLTGSGSGSSEVNFTVPARGLSANIVPSTATWIRLLLPTNSWGGYGFGGRFQLLVAVAPGYYQFLDIGASCASNGQGIPANPTFQQFQNVASLAFPSVFFLDQVRISWDGGNNAVLDVHVNASSIAVGGTVTFTALNPQGNLLFPAALTQGVTAYSNSQTWNLSPGVILTNLPTNYVASPSSAGTTTLTAGQNVTILENASQLATYTVNLPPTATDEQIVSVSSWSGIAALTVGAGSGQTMAWTPPANVMAAAGGVFKARFRAFNATWNPA